MQRQPEFMGFRAQTGDAFPWKFISCCNCAGVCQAGPCEHPGWQGLLLPARCDAFLACLIMEVATFPLVLLLHWINPDTPC